MPKNAAETLSPRQIRALAALLAGTTRAEAARQAGVSERVVYKWLATPAFRQALREQQEELFTELINALLGLKSEAIEAVRSALRSSEDAVRARAGLSVLRLLLDAWQQHHLADSLEEVRELVESRARAERMSATDE